MLLPQYHLTRIVTIMILMLTAFSCTKPSTEPNQYEGLEIDKYAMAATAAENDCIETNDIGPLSAEESIPTVLGAALQGNPFSTDVIQTAWRNLHGGTKRFFPTHQYVRFKPANDDQLAVLVDNPTLDLFDYPLDREVVTEGDYYPQPGIGENELPWFYTVVPVGFTPPAGITYEVLQSVYLTDDLALETEALRITGNPIEPDCNSGASGGASTASSPWFCPRIGPCRPPGPPVPGTDANQPAGWIRVRDKQLGVDQGVPNAKVVARRWFKIERTQTDNDGRFVCGRRFRNKVNIIVKMQNSEVEVRAIKSVYFWQIWFPVKTSIGKFSGILNNVNYVFTDDNEDKTNQHKLWFAGTVLRSYADYNTMAAQQGVGPAPSDLTVLLSTLGSSGSGSAPMNRHRTNAGAMPQSYVEYFLAHPGTSALSQLFNYLYNSKLLAGVDVSFGYHKTDFQSSDARELIYHELAHASHFQQVGQQWWNSFVYAVASETARFGINGTASPYGDGAVGEVSDYIGLAESWAYHLGHFFTNTTYGASSAASGYFGIWYANNSPINGLSVNLNALENYAPNNSNYSFSWIPSGLYYDLFDSRVDLQFVNDNVSGYTNQQFFAALISSTKSVTQFRSRLLLNSGNNQANAVNLLFNSYGY